MKQDPVAIVGASSSGLFTAYLLAQAGIPVNVYERTAQLAPTSRTLIVTSELNRVLGFVPESAIVNRIHTFELYAKDVVARVALEDPDWIVERGELTRLLAARAETAGAKLNFAHRFSGFEIENGRATAVFSRTNQGPAVRVTAGTVIGADGAHSAVARAIGQKKRPNVVVMQARIALPAGHDPRVCQIWFARQDTPYFYWLLPESATTAVLGFMADEGCHARAKLDNFLRERRLEPIEYQGAVIAMYEPLPSPVEQVGETKVLMVGDAAGQVKVTTVGGTVSGLWGARAAAAAIISGSDYSRALRGLTREMWLHWLVRKILNRVDDDGYAQLLRLVQGRTRDILQRRNRDQMAGAFLSILAGEPRLLLLAARACLTSPPIVDRKLSLPPVWPVRDTHQSRPGTRIAPASDTPT